MAVTQEIGPSQRGGLYHLPENELAIGSTLGGPKVACIIKATGALQTVYSVDFGQSLFGAVVVRHYDEDAGVYLAQDKLGTFTLHPEHQEHHFPLPLNISVHETIFGSGSIWFDYGKLNLCLPEPCVAPTAAASI